MGFLKRVLTGRFTKKKEPKIYVPEFQAASYSAYSMPRPSADYDRLTVDANELRKQRKASSTSRAKKIAKRAPSPGPSLAPTVRSSIPDALGETDSLRLPSSGTPSLLPTPRTVDSLPQSRDSYRVTVHGRVRHSSTEFPHANPPLSCSRSRSVTPSTPESALDSPFPQDPLSPEDATRLQRLRQDPSVTSLINLLDIAGKPKPNAFVNTPARRPNRTSLRVLLGSPLVADQDDSHEGDISWAERFLEERIGAANYDQEFYQHNHNLGKEHEKTLNTINTSCSSEADDPALSSLQVERGTIEEISLTSESSDASSISLHGPKQDFDLMRSPSHRASEVFSFLLDSKDRRGRTPSLTPSHSSLGMDEVTARLPASSSSEIVKPLPKLPSSIPAKERPMSFLHKLQEGDNRLPNEQRIRTSSLPLLSLDQFGNESLDDPFIDNTPSRAPKTSQRSLIATQTTYLKAGPVYTSAPVRDAPGSSQTRQRSQTLSKLTGAGLPLPTHLEVEAGRPLRKLSASPGDFMAEIRKRAASTVGSLVSRSKPTNNKRYTDRFVAIEWDKEWER